MRRPLDRRSYLAVLLATTTAGCSLFEGERMPETATPRMPMRDLLAGEILAVGDGLEETRISPEETETPVQDALDALAEVGGGRVFLPPKRIFERGPIRPHENTGIYGFGMNVSVVEIASQGVDGIRFDRENRANRFHVDGFELRGPGVDAQTGAAIHFLPNSQDPVRDPADFHIGRLYCREWANSVYRVEEKVGPFQCRHDFLRADDCDAGDQDALIEWHSDYGPANWFGTVVAYPTARASGQNTRLLYQRGGELTVGDITTGTTTGRLVDTENGRLHVGRLHYEPVGQLTVPESLVRIGRNGATRFEDVLVDSEAVRYVYELGRGAGNAIMFGPPGGRGEFTENVVNVTDRLDADRLSWYFGRREEVDVTGPSQTGSLRVLGTAGQPMG